MRVRPVGPTALLLEDDDVAGWAAAVQQLVTDGALPRPAEVVPGARTLLLDGLDPGLATEVLAGATPLPAARRPGGPVVEVPVVYDGADLPEIAAHWQVTEAQVVARHTAAPWRVAFCGFAPGFPYLLGDLPPVPRRATPRTRVPAGSVALAGPWCGIYPTASPGGWQLLGRTGVALFDPGREPPALLPPGTRVRFVATDRVDPPPEPDPPSDPPPGRTLTVVRPGTLTTVQDAGRPGLAHLGVPRAGPLDVSAAQLANRLVGNPPDAALLETTLDGVALRADTALTLAVTGALAPVTVDGRAAPWGQPVGLLPGQVLDVGPPGTGVRCCVAVAGGVATGPVLGSRARCTLSGLGPPPLTAGRVLPVGPWPGLPAPVDLALPPTAGDVVLRLHPGPHDEGGEARAALEHGPYVLRDSSRVGARLDGPAVPRPDGELPSEGMVLGAVQVPPDGRPVVLLADHGTTGGYPVVAVVDPRDLGALAQARPGTPVRFRGPA